MKRFLASALVILITVFSFPITSSFGSETGLDEFLASFDYKARKEMKVGSAELVEMVKSGQAVLVDIRFPEEVASWSVGFSINIPLNELPTRLSELPKGKRIVTACPHKDRAIIAMTYLKSKGYNAAYLKDGLTGLVELLRGDEALLLQKALNNSGQKTDTRQ